LGSGLLPVTYLVILAVFPVVTIYTLTGIRTVDPARVTMLKLMGAGRLKVARKILLPHTARYLITSIVLALPHALTIAIGGEILFGTTQGIGGTLFSASQLFQSSQVLATLVIATVLSVVLIGLTRIVERRLFRADVKSP